MALKTTTIRLPEDLLTRSKALAKRMDIDLIDLIRDGLWDKVTQIEGRLRAEADQKARDADSKQERRRLAVRLDDNAALAPKLDVEIESKNEPVDPLYIRHAENIVRVYDDVSERRLAALTAIKDICEHNPLTSDALDVERKLHRVVEKMRAEPASTSTIGTPLTRIAKPVQTQAQIPVAAVPMPGIFEKLFNFAIGNAPAETTAPARAITYNEVAASYDEPKIEIESELDNEKEE